MRGLLVLICFNIACASYPYVWVQDLPETPNEQRIAAGDTITVVVQGQNALSGDFLVREHGAYLQPLVGEIPVAGLTPEVAAAELIHRLKGFVVEPKVMVSISIPRVVRVSVVGEVVRPGNYDLEISEGLLGALARAGDLTEFAKRDGIYVIRKEPAPMRIRFRYVDLVGAEPRAIRFSLQDNDVVAVE